jgi:hypothetical protein
MQTSRVAEVIIVEDIPADFVKAYTSLVLEKRCSYTSHIIALWKSGHSLFRPLTNAADSQLGLPFAKALLFIAL